MKDFIINDKCFNKTKLPDGIIIYKLKPEIEKN